MNWTKNQIKSVVYDLAEENSFACRALFKIVEIKIGSEVPTLAVSLSNAPVLHINRYFLNRHIKSEDDLKAVLMHEFLHVILQHTEKYESMTPLLNFALDAVINSLIHRVCGERFSNFFREFYSFWSFTVLLRPWIPNAPYWEFNDNLSRIHYNIYIGCYCADELYELLKSLERIVSGKKNPMLIGNHGQFNNRPSPQKKATERENYFKTIASDNEKFLKETIQKMDGTQIWRNSRSRGVNIKSRNLSVGIIKKLNLQYWEAKTLRLLQNCMQEIGSKVNHKETYQLLPILSRTDRRAFSTFGTGGFLPMAYHIQESQLPDKSIAVYLDVSGSINSELNVLTTLLYHFRGYIRPPLWAFSNSVKAAKFTDGKLDYETTLGTSIGCVFDHMRQQKIKSCLIVTDGYTESITPVMLNGLDKEKIRVLISHSGDGKEFEKAKIKFLKMGPLWK